MDAGPLTKLTVDDVIPGGAVRWGRRRARRGKRLWWVLAAAALLLVVLVAGRASAPPSAAHARSVLRIAMTAGDLPTTTGAPTQGLEGVRFVGYPIFEPLVAWTFGSRTGRPASSHGWPRPGPPIRPTATGGSSTCGAT